MLRRCDDEPCHQETPLGYVPREGDLNTQGLGDIDMKTLFSMPKDFWLQEVNTIIIIKKYTYFNHTIFKIINTIMFSFQADAIEKYFKEEVGDDLPKEMWNELDTLRKNMERS